MAFHFLPRHSEQIQVGFRRHAGHRGGEGEAGRQPASRQHAAGRSAPAATATSLSSPPQVGGDAWVGRRKASKVLQHPTPVFSSSLDPLENPQTSLKTLVSAVCKVSDDLQTVPFLPGPHLRVFRKNRRKSQGEVCLARSRRMHNCLSLTTFLSLFR